MARPDLKAGFDGWQASDPTPQEKSESMDTIFHIYFIDNIIYTVNYADYVCI